MKITLNAPLLPTPDPGARMPELSLLATPARSAVLLAVPEAGMAELRDKKATSALIKLTGVPPHDMPDRWDTLWRHSSNTPQ